LADGVAEFSELAHEMFTATGHCSATQRTGESLMRTAVQIVVILCALLNVWTQAQAIDRSEAAKAPGKSALTIDRSHTALLVMDYQNDIVAMVPEAARTSLLDKASAIIKAARQAHLPVIYVVVRFRDGYPEMSRQNKHFALLKETGWLPEETPGAEIHARVAPEFGDIIITKRRAGAFSTTDLEPLLRANGITTLVMFGIATSGVILSTVRWAADMEYSMVVVSDECADTDREVHCALTEKILPTKATVVTAREFVKAASFAKQLTVVPH
jgi:nicotinamidase-related amidase